MRNRLGLSSRLAALFASFVGSLLLAQDAPVAKPALHIVGPITAVAPDQSTLTVKADKDGQSYTFTLANTKTLLKVPPGAKDLKTAVRINPQDLQAGDRVDVRYADTDAAASPIPARSVLLMSASELQEAHQQESAEWQNSIAGSVTAADPSSGTLTVQTRSADGPKTLSVQTSAATVFTRFSPEHPTTPDKSSLSAIKSGDQVRIVANAQIGTPSDQGGNIQAKKVYSGSFRTVPSTVVSVDTAANSLTVRDLQSKQTLTVAITPETTLRKLPPMIAAGIARRFSGAASPAGSGSAPSGGSPSAQASSSRAAGPGAGAPGGAWRGGGDPSRMLEHLPPINLSDLKPGDAVVLTVAETKDPTRPAVTTVIAGVEPIFQSAPPAQRRSSGGSDWSLDMGVPAQ